MTLQVRRLADLPACALDNDVVLELQGEKHALVAVVDQLSHVLREHPPLEPPGGAPPALKALARGGGTASVPSSLAGAAAHGGGVAVY